MKPKAPRTLLQAVQYFADPEVSFGFMTRVRWPNGVECPSCGRKDPYFIATRRIWKCKNRHDRQQFSLKIGSIFEDSPLSLNKWMAVIWLLGNCKNGVSSYEIHRDLGVTQRTGWFMLHRVRLAMHVGSFEKKCSREAEVDESWVGELSSNMHRSERAVKITGTGGAGKTVGFALLERHGEVRARVVRNVRKSTLAPIIRQHVEPGSTVYTDQSISYRGLGATGEYLHQVINHAEAYVNGRISTNGAENFWSVLKRTLKGTYVHVAPFHLDRLDAQTWRFNNRKLDDGERFDLAIASVVGKRLTYAELTGKDEEAKGETAPPL